MPETVISALVMLFVAVGAFEVTSMFFGQRIAGATAPVGPAGQRDRLLVLLAALGGNRLVAALQIGLLAFLAAGSIRLLGQEGVFSSPSRQGFPP
jgi:hypothetical protein